MPHKTLIPFSFFVILLAVFNTAIAEPFSHTASYEVCFTPGDNCTRLIVNTLAKAKKSIFVQAYSFTSTTIAKSLRIAKTNGVAVQVILDKTIIKSGKYSILTYLTNANIPVWIDDQVNIAHNKVMIIDEHIVITGSFNFTRAAQYNNAENVLIIHDDNLARKYLQNWYRRKSFSIPVTEFKPHNNDLGTSKSALVNFLWKVLF